jgi:hypothetical protein
MCAKLDTAFVCFMSYFPAMLLRYFLDYLEVVPVSPVFTGFSVIFTFHMRCSSIVRTLYFNVLSASFFFFNHISVSWNCNVYWQTCSFFIIMSFFLLGLPRWFVLVDSLMWLHHPHILFLLILVYAHTSYYCCYYYYHRLYLLLYQLILSSFLLYVHTGGLSRTRSSVMMKIQMVGNQNFPWNLICSQNSWKCCAM